jgi:hypothetical protein
VLQALATFARVPSHHSTSDFVYDAQSAERGYRDTAALRAEVKDATLPALDLQKAAIFGLRMASELEKSETRAKFARIHDELLSPSIVHRIRPAAWALWYASAQRETAEAAASTQRLSLDTLKRADELRKRMMRVAEYMFVDDDELGAEIASIRAGVGYADLASDLTRLAAIYDAKKSLLSAAGEHYRAGDAKQARLVTGAILSELAAGESKSAMEARTEAARAFVVLASAYDRVRRFGLAMFDDGESRFPSVYSIRGGSRPNRFGGDSDGGDRPGGETPTA